MTMQTGVRFRVWIRCGVWAACCGMVVAGLSYAAGPLSAGSDDASTATKLDYPPSHASGHVDRYHGTEVPDPYRWLEDADSEATRQWVAAQNRLTFAQLEKIPGRESLRERLTQLWDYEKFGVPIQRGGRYFFTRNSGLQNQSVLYTADGLAEPPRVLLDPNTLSADGTVALADYTASEDGRLLAYGISRAGSDWQEWQVRDVATARDLDDHLRWVKFSGVSWTPDGEGFYYSRYAEPNEATKLVDTNYFQKLYYHRIGRPQEEDELIYERKDHKEWGFDGEVTDDGRYLMISVWRGSESKNGIFYRDLAADDAPVVELFNEFEAEYLFVGNDGPVFWFRTDRDAPRGRLVAVDTLHPAPDNWRETIPQAADALRSVSLVGDRFVALYLHDAHSVAKVFSLEGELVDAVDLPGIGSVSGFAGRREDRETFYSFTSYTTPTAIYRYDVAQRRSQLFRTPKLTFDPDDYETRQVFYRSKDGTRAPMFLTYKKAISRDGGRPTLLYAYGGFDISIVPRFSVLSLVWMEQGGLYAVPNLRGGGEYGREWHEAGMKEKKQNVFDDFIAAAEWLIDNGYTSRNRLAIMGRSNGGLLVGACMTQRPDLYAVALPGVGVMDMLRFHKFTIGWAWVGEYGSSDNAADFKYLYAYSPLHNLRTGTAYPATLITTADHDDRVVPAHSFKFAATLQAAQSGTAPTLIRIDTRAGHGAGKPTSKQVEESADILGFTLDQMGIDVARPADR